MFAKKCFSAIAVLLFLIAIPFSAYADQEGCVYNRTVYPQGDQMCQSGTMMRCEEGAWSATGFCESEPMPEPIASGGDVMESDED